MNFHLPLIQTATERYPYNDGFEVGKIHIAEMNPQHSNQPLGRGGGKQQVRTQTCIIARQAQRSAMIKSVDIHESMIGIRTNHFAYKALHNKEALHIKH